jgi:Arc/MetJ family transcription regulator
MGKTLIDIDLELLSQAQEILGTTTKKATVNGALREVVRRWAAVQLGELARGGVFDELLKRENGQLPGELVEQPCP